jgi:hypothetical protein
MSNGPSANNLLAGESAERKLMQLDQLNPWKASVRQRLEQSWEELWRHVQLAVEHSMPSIRHFITEALTTGAGFQHHQGEAPGPRSMHFAARK